MVALHKNRTLVSFPDCCSQNNCGIFERPLLCIADFRPCDLKDHGADLQFMCLSEGRPYRIVSESPDIHGRNGEPRIVSPHVFIQTLDRGWNSAVCLCNFFNKEEEPLFLFIVL